ncbi:MAG: hypothetical protein WC708_18700 [Lentisphaeria bacterium]
MLLVDRFNQYLAILVREHAAKPNAFADGCEAVHRGEAGHLLMAWMILKRMGAPSLVASAEFDVAWFLPDKLVKVRQCQVQNVKYAKGVLSFDRLAAVLPMPINDRARPALKMAPILDDLNRDELKIAGLRAARYEVVIDGEVVATVAADDLAKGWNLASVVTPDTRQADDVLGWVYNKNNFYSHWRDIRMNGGTPEQLAEPEREIAINETRINTARQPKMRHFEVRPVKEPGQKRRLKAELPT